MGNRDAMFPIPLWNMCDRVAENLSRTNNSRRLAFCLEYPFEGKPTAIRKIKKNNFKK
jgi:hypothetical protein